MLGFHTGLFVRERNELIVQKTVLLVESGYTAPVNVNLDPLDCFYGPTKLVVEILLHVNFGLECRRGDIPIKPYETLYNV